MNTTARRLVTGLALAAGVSVALVPLAAAAPAQAHTYLVSSTPSSGETLTTLPTAFDITANEDLLTLEGQTNGFAFQIVDAAGLHYESGCVDVEGAMMSMEARLGAPGAYTALWQVVSDDGHTVSDEFAFTWAPADGAVLTPGSATAPACGEVPAPVDPSSPSATPPVAAPGTGQSSVPLGTVLGIGGAVLAAGIAVAVAIVFLGRRKPTPTP